MRVKEEAKKRLDRRKRERLEEEEPEKGRKKESGPTL